MWPGSLRCLMKVCSCFRCFVPILHPAVPSLLQRWVCHLQTERRTVTCMKSIHEKSRSSCLIRPCRSSITPTTQQSGFSSKEVIIRRRKKSEIYFLFVLQKWESVLWAVRMKASPPPLHQHQQEGTCSQRTTEIWLFLQFFSFYFL